MKREIHRTLKRAIRLSDMAVITSDDLLNLDRDKYHEIRRAATPARKGTPSFVCEECGFSVYAPREWRTKLPYWRHNKGAPQTCPWWTGDPSSIDEVSASQFQGAQESPLHLRIKNLVAELLSADPATEDGSVIVDKYIQSEHGRRRPDVRAIYNGRPVAFEIQLATTQLPIIVARESFYEREGRHLIWLTWNFEPVPRAQLRASIDDILYSHNNNLFSLDATVVAESIANGIFLVRAYWEHGSGWNSKILALPDLVWDGPRLPFAVAPPLPWHLEFRALWLTYTDSLGTLDISKGKLLNEITNKLGESQLQPDSFDIEDLAALFNAILSFTEGKPVGSAQRNNTEVINTFLSSDRRFRFARIMRKVISTTEKQLLEKPSVAKKLSDAEKTKQDGRGSIAGKLVLLVFPELF
jgi:hypothetical protein